MKLLNLIALFVSTSLFFAADVSWASNASPDPIKNTKSHARDLLRGPAEERVASLEPLAEGVVRVAGEVSQRIEGIGMSAETVAEKSGGLVAGRAAAKKRTKRKYGSNWRPGFLGKFKASRERESGRKKSLREYLRAVARHEIRKRISGKAVTNLDYAQVVEEMTQDFMAELSKAAMKRKASPAPKRNRKATREEATATDLIANDA